MPKKTLPFIVLAVILGPLALVEVSNIENGRAIALLLSIVILWLTELLPLPVTGLLVPVLIVFYGIFPAGDAFMPFGSDILFLFIGCFLLAHAMQKHGWDKRMAYWILSSKYGAKSPAALITLIGGICFVLSMWLSNTATAAMMVPICLGIIAILKEELATEKQRRRFSTRALLTTAFASSIGGLATPIGTPPNLIAIQFLKTNGVDISFIEWMGFGLPIAALMFIALIVIMHFRFRLEPVDLKTVREHFDQKFRDLGPVKTGEYQVAAVFALAVFLWIAPGLLKIALPEAAWVTTVAERLPMSGVGIGASLILFFLPAGKRLNLDWSDAKHIDWGTILLFGGGLTLGKMLSDTGLAETLGLFAFNPEWGVLALVAGAVLFGIIVSEFSSNTASAAIVIPILLTVLAQPGFEHVSPPLVIMACAFGASYGFMLPVSTPPNAIVYGTGKLKVHDMFTTGILFDLTGAVLIIGATLLLNRLGIF